MMRKILMGAALVMVGASLSACAGGGGSKTATNQPPVQGAPFEDQFGSATGFGTAFRGARPTGEPRDVNAGDVVAVSVTAEPVWLPGT